MRPGLYGRIGQPACGRQRGLSDGGQLVPEPPPLGMAAEGPDQLPGVDVGPGGGSVVDEGQQHRMLGGEPVHGLLVGREGFRRGGRCRCGKGDRIPGRLQRPGGGVRGVDGG